MTLDERGAYKSIYGDLVYSVEKYYPRPVKAQIERDNVTMQMLANCSMEQQRQYQQQLRNQPIGMFRSPYWPWF